MRSVLSQSSLVMLGPKRAHVDCFVTEDFCMLSFFFLRTICNDINLIPRENTVPREFVQHHLPYVYSLTVSDATECGLS